MLTLETAVNLLSQYIGAGKEPKIQINLVTERYLKAADPVGSLEKVTFTVTADANGEGFIILPDRYDTIRGAVENATSTTLCGRPLPVRPDYYEYSLGNMGMIKGSDPMRGIIPIQLTESDTTTFLDAGLQQRKYKVPACPTAGSQTFFTVICKRAFQFLTDDAAILPVQNLGALKIGLKALDKEDAEDYVRSNQLWSMGMKLLADEKENQSGPEALGKVQIDDDFCLAAVGQENWGWGGGWDW